TPGARPGVRRSNRERGSGATTHAGEGPGRARRGPHPPHAGQRRERSAQPRAHHGTANAIKQACLFLVTERTTEVTAGVRLAPAASPTRRTDRPRSPRPGAPAEPRRRPRPAGRGPVPTRRGSAAPATG